MVKRGFDFKLTATWIHDVKTAFVKRELQTSQCRHRADQGPQVRADARHPQPARRRRRVVGRRPARRPAAGPVGCVQPRLRPQRIATASTRSRSCGPSERPDLRRPDELDDPARRHPSLQRRSRQRPDHVVGPRRPAQPAVHAAARTSSGQPRRLPRSPAEGLRIPGRRHHLGGVQPEARRHQADLDAELRRLAGRVQGPSASTRRTPAPTPRSGRATTSSSGRRSCRSASAGSSLISAPGTTCLSAPTAARSRSTVRRRPASTRSSGRA